MPEQRLYESIRPITLFGIPPAERAQETRLAESTLRRTADAFDAQGMTSLFRPTKHQREDQHRSLPVPMRQLIVDLKTEYPGFSLREIADICYVQFARRPSHNTVKQVLADGPPPSRTTRQYPHYADIPDPAERRLAAIRGAYLQVARKTIYQILKRWVEEGMRGLEDKSQFRIVIWSAILPNASAPPSSIAWHLLLDVTKWRIVPLALWKDFSPALNKK